MIRIPVYIGQVIDMSTIILFFLLLFYLYKDYRCKENYMVAIICTIIISFIDNKFNATSELLIPFTLFFLIKPVKHQIKNKLFLYLFSYLIIAFSSGVSGYAITRFIDIRHLNKISVIMTFIGVHTVLLYIMVTLITLSGTFLFKTLKKYIDFSDAIIRKMIFIAISVLTVSFVTIIYISRLLQQQAILLLFNLLIMFIISVFTLLGLFFYINGYLKQVQAEKKYQKIQNDRTYLKELQNNYDDLRKFKHDYKNLLLSISVLLSENKITAAKTSLNKFLELSNQTNFTTNDQANILSRISDDLIRGLIISKLNSAKRHNIKMNLEIDNDISSFGNQQADIIRILGILFDNAIESALRSPERKVNFALLRDNDTYEFILQNSTKDKYVNLEHIQHLGYTTKKSHTGLGLATVHQICDQNDYLIQYKLAEYKFTCTLTI